MKYDSSNHKIRKIYLKTQKTEDKLNKKENKIIKIEDYTKQLQQPSHYWKTIREYSSGWIFLDQKDAGGGWTHNYKNIVLELGIIPTEFLPFIRYNIIYSPIIDLDNEELNILDAFQLEDVGSDTVKKIKLWIGIKLATQTSVQFSVKINAYVYNPHIYI